MSKGSFGLDVLIVVSSDPRYDTRSSKYLSTLLEAGFKAKVVGISSDGTGERKEELVRALVSAKGGKRFFLEFYQKVIPEMYRSPAKIVIAGDLFSLPPAIINKHRYSKGAKPVKLIYDSKELYEELPSLKAKRTSFLFWNLVEKSSIRYVDAVLTVNQSIADILEAKWHLPTSVVMNVPDLSNPPNTTEKSFDKIFLTFSGGLQRGRGLHNLINLLTVLPEKYELRFVGDGILRKELEQQALSLKLEKRVHFVGRVNNSEVVNELSKSHIGVYLMENTGLCHYLALPNKFFQFISARLPVIVPHFPEMEKIVRQYEIGAAVDPTNIHETAQKVLQFTSDKNMYDRFVSNCEKAAGVLNWQVEKEKFLKAVHNLV